MEAIGNCSKEKIYQEWFLIADLDFDGRVTGNDATKFFAKSNLSRQDLKQVWAIVDSKRQGFLGFKEFVTAMQLVLLAQAGKPITNESLNSEVDAESINPPTMEGLDALKSKKKRTGKKSDPEINGSPVLQQSLSASWFSSRLSKKLPPMSSVTSIIDGLKRLYLQKLKPLEVAYCYNDFVSPPLTNSDFDAKPMVMTS